MFVLPLLAALALDRIVAVVDDEPIFLSEFRRREAPFLLRTPGSERERMDRELLQRMIDERLEAKEAEKAHLTVSSSEVDSGIQMVLGQAKLTMGQLLEEVKKQGMTEAEYREEIRRQVLEGKLIQLRVRGRVNVTDADARAVYDKWVKEQSGPNADVDLRILAVQDEALAKQVAADARSGTDFCTLVTKHSLDKTTTSTCGSRGPLKRSDLTNEIASATATLAPGKITGPLSTNGYWVVIQRAPSAPIPTFEKVKDDMKQRAFLDATERERTVWLEGLRKQAYIEVKK